MTARRGGHTRPGQGHLCAAEAQRLAKALLFAIHLAPVSAR